MLKGIILLLLACSVKAQVFNIDNCKILEYAKEQEQYWPDDIAIFNDKNDKVYLDKIEDKPILVVFWATWCSYCVNEMASLDVLKKDFKKLPLEILAISEDYAGLTVIDKFYEDRQIRHLDVLYDWRFQLFNALKLNNLPYAFLIDRNKKIILSFEGLVKWHNPQIRQLLLSYIPGNLPMPQNTYKENFISLKVKSQPINK